MSHLLIKQIYEFFVTILPHVLFNPLHRMQGKGVLVCNFCAVSFRIKEFSVRFI